MLSKVFSVATLALVGYSITAAYTQRSALQLRQEQQASYWPRHRTSLSGRYRRGVWIVSPTRSSYSSFQGGSPSSGK
ncbi:MAG: hypothetical protein HC934_08575 [Acaryochloridaceae cyanobacterium SU_2_1]|nr:hypothetical protein [Acaryochloridaceae cyanobacterium SU_2_1]NJM95718.1 hypothetical protein [Acaryochloridaceae cyanobacterium CSU_5_19]